MRDDRTVEAVALRIMELQDSFRPQELANIAWSCAKLSWRNGPLLGALSSSTQRKIHAFNAKDLASTTWAFQAISWADGPCLTLVGDASLRIMSEFNPQDLANTAWVYAA